MIRPYDIYKALMPVVNIRRRCPPYLCLLLVRGFLRTRVVQSLGTTQLRSLILTLVLTATPIHGLIGQLHYLVIPIQLGREIRKRTEVSCSVFLEDKQLTARRKIQEAVPRTMQHAGATLYSWTVVKR
jgi:hypothetical protein